MPVVGSADVRINADGTTFGPQLQRILSSQNNIVRQSGTQAGNEYSRGFGSGLTAGIRNAMQNAQREISKGLNVDGLYERPLSAEMSRATQSAQRTLRQGSRGLENEASDAGRRTGSAFSRSFGRIMNSDLAKESSRAANAFTQVYASGNAMAALLGSAAGGVSALVSGLGMLVGAAGSAASSLAAIGPALGAILQGGIATSVAFKGVGQAISAGMNQATAATNKSTGASESNKRSIIAAQRAVADARQRVAEVVIQNAERMRQADERVADAVENVKEAEQDLLRAQRELTQAQRDLTAARKDAREELQQLAFSAEDAALAEQRAGLNLEDAYAELKAVQNLPADNRTRREAELAFKEAELNYREAKDRASDLAEEQQEAAQKGIAGTKAYQAAQKDVASAQEGVLSAQKGVNDAEEQLADARAERSRVAAQNARDLAKAHQAVSRAQEDLANAAKGSGAAQTQAAKAVDKYAEALEGLSPSARRFVQYMVDNKNKFNDFKKAVQEPFFAKFTPAFIDFSENVLGDLATKLGETSATMGEFSAQLLGMMNIKNLGPIMDQNNDFLKIFADETEDGTSALEDLVTIFLQVYKALGPLTTRFGNFLAGVLDSKAAFLSSEEGLKSLTDFFNRAGDRMSTFFNIFKSITGMFGTIFTAARKPIDDFLKYFETSFADLNKSAKENSDAIGEHFAGVEKNLEPLLDLVGQLGLMFLKMGSAPELGETFKILQGALPDLQRILDVAAQSGPAFAKLVVSVVKLIASFADTGSMEVFFGTLTGIADTLNKVFGNKTVQNILAIAGPILAAVKALSLFKLGVQAVGKIILGGFVNATKMFGLGAKDGKAYAAGFRSTAGNLPVTVTPVPGKAPVADAGPQAAVLPGGGADVEKQAAKPVGAIGKVGGALKSIGGVALRLLGIFGLIFTAIQILLPIFQALYKSNDGFKKAIDGLVGSLSGLFSTIVSAVAPALQAIGNAFGALMAAIAPVVAALVAKLMPVVTRLAQLFIATLVPIIEELAPVFMDAFSQIIGAVMGLVSAILPQVMQIVNLFINVLVPVIMQLIPVFMLVFQTIAQIVAQLVPILVPIITMIVNLLVQILVPVFQLVAQVVQQAAQLVIAALQTLLPVIIPIITFLVNLLVKILIPVFQAIAIAAKIAFSVLAVVIKVAIAVVTVILQALILYITKILVPTLKLIGSAAEAMAKLFAAAIRGAFTAFQTIWSTILKPAIQAVRDAIAKISETASKMNKDFQAAIHAGFKYLQDQYDKYVKPVFTALETALGKVSGWAKNAVTAFGKNWDDLTGKLKTPVKDAVEWINTHLIGKLNAVTSKFGLSLSKISTAGMAEGGEVTGQGGPTEDNQLRALSVGEFVMKNRSSKKIGYQALRYMNETGEMPHLKPEGGWISDGWAKLSSEAKKWATDGIKKTLSGIWDKTIGPWANGMADSDKWGKKFIGGIVKALKSHVLDWGGKRDTEADKLKAKYDAQQAAKGGGGVPRGSVNNPSGKVSAGNGKFTNLFAANLNKAEKIAHAHIRIFQAGWRPATSYSGTSHRGDAIDLQVNNALIRALRKVGIAAGDRTGLGNWVGHVHAIPGPKSGYPRGSAVWQWSDYKRRGGASQGLRSPWGLAEGGVVPAVEGGIHAIIGEGGRPERVEPLDRQGLSVRDRALIQQIVDQLTAGKQSQTGGAATVVRVYIGDSELRDIVRYEISDGESTLAKSLSTGRRSP